MRTAMAFLVLVVSCFQSPAQIGFARARAGFDIGMVVVNTHRIDADLAFDVAGRGDIAVSFGKFGEAHYKPTIGVFFGGSSDHAFRYDITGLWYTAHYDDFALEVHLDIADIAYYPPVPEKLFVKPYAGLGLTVVIDHWSREVVYDGPVPAYQAYYWTEDGTFAHAGFNAYAGVDFKINDRIAPFVEIRGRASQWDLFKLTGGMMFTITSKPVY